MSLLHEALKKAEKAEGSAMGGGAFVDGGETSSHPLRLFLLSAVALVGVAAVVWFYVLKRPSETAAPQPKQFSTPLEIAGGPEAPQLKEEAASLIKAGRFDEAKKQLEKVVILEPLNAVAYNDLGYVLKKLNKSDEAFDQYRKALSINPQCAECLNNLGVLYLSSRSLAQAETQFQKALEVRPDYADPYFHLGLLMEARGDLTGAKKNYSKFMELARGISADFLLKVQGRVAGLRIP